MEGEKKIFKSKKRDKKYLRKKGQILKRDNENPSYSRSSWSRKEAKMNKPPKYGNNKSRKSTIKKKPLTEIAYSVLENINPEWP